MVPNRATHHKLSFKRNNCNIARLNSDVLPFALKSIILLKRNDFLMLIKFLCAFSKLNLLETITVGIHM